MECLSGSYDANPLSMTSIISILEQIFVSPTVFLLLAVVKICGGMRNFFSLRNFFYRDTEERLGNLLAPSKQASFESFFSLSLSSQKSCVK